MKLCLVARGLIPSKWRLQPWRYLLETARSFQRQGHVVTIISDQYPGGPAQDVLEGVKIWRVPDVRPVWWRSNVPLREAIARCQPDRIVWHVGLSSFFHFDVAGQFEAPSVGIFTSPIYTPSELLRLGSTLITERHMLALHVAGLLVPEWAIRRIIYAQGLQHLVTLSKTAQQELVKRGISPKRVTVIRPGLDAHWLESSPIENTLSARREVGIADDDTLVVYAGAPFRFRGLDQLVEALVQARKKAKTLKLLILSRSANNEFALAEQRVKNRVRCLGLDGAVTWKSGFLSPADVKRYMGAADVVALPFRIVPSDMPLSVLEAQALGKPVVTTNTNCLPELVLPGSGFTVSSTRLNDLVQALTWLATQHDARRTMGESARLAAQQWGDWDTLDHQWARLWETL